MSIKIMSQVWEHASAGGAELLVLLALADFSDDEGNSFPSISTLARKTRTSERHIHRVLASLVDRGALVSDPSYRSDGSQTSNRYTLVLKSGHHAVGEGDIMSIPPHDTMSGGALTPCPPPPATPCPSPPMTRCQSLEPSVEPSVEPSERYIAREAVVAAGDTDETMLFREYQLAGGIDGFAAFSKQLRSMREKGVRDADAMRWYAENRGSHAYEARDALVPRPARQRACMDLSGIYGPDSGGGDQ